MNITWTLGWLGETNIKVPASRVRETVEALIILGFNPVVTLDNDSQN